MAKALPLQPELPLWGATEAPAPPVGAARRIVLGDRVVPYVLRRSRRRTIGLTVDRAGLRVGAPQRATLGEVERLIERHAAWVLDKLAEWVGSDRRQRIRIVDGAVLPVLGGEVQVRIEDGATRCIWEEASLVLRLRDPAVAARLAEMALRARARERFAERLAVFAERMRLDVPALSLSSARTRWGSCSRDTGIRLNWRLVHCAPHLVDYVVVHELAHLRQMNHSARFWREVEAAFPAYREARSELRALSECLPELC